MSSSFLRVGIALTGMAVVVFVVGAGACGGNVVVDAMSAGTGTTSSTHGTGGTGGVTGQGGTVSTSTVIMTSVVASTGTNGGTTTASIASTGTSPACTCAFACQVAATCGIPANQCAAACSNLPQSEIDCVCQAGFSNCGSALSCLTGGMTSAVATGTGVGATSSGGTTGACGKCATSAALNQCSASYQACAQNPECQAILNCHTVCGYGQACTAKCDAAHPSGESEYQALIGCAVCQQCVGSCAGQSVWNQYCSMAAAGG
jgi:hypothetical protein